jgi:hypothetical protein
MNVLWVCAAGHRGEYATAAITTKTDASLPDAKHAKSCGATVLTTTTPALAARFGGES